MIVFQNLNLSCKPQSIGLARELFVLRKPGASFSGSQVVSAMDSPVIQVVIPNAAGGAFTMPVQEMT